MTATTGRGDRAAMRSRLRILAADLDAVNELLCGEQNRLVDSLLDLVDKYGGVDAINRSAAEAGRLDNRLARLTAEGSPYLAGLEWLAGQRDSGAFVSIQEYRRSVLGVSAGTVRMLGLALVPATIGGFALAALATLGILPAGAWGATVAIGSLASLALLVVGLHRWLYIGIAIDLVLLWVALVTAWTPDQLD